MKLKDLAKKFDCAIWDAEKEIQIHFRGADGKPKHKDIHFASIGEFEGKMRIELIGDFEIKEKE